MSPSTRILPIYIVNTLQQLEPVTYNIGQPSNSSGVYIYNFI